MITESEWQTRKRRIDPKLDDAGWPKAASSRFPGPRRSEEEPTADGPADYALWLDGAAVGVVEAKKVTLGPRRACAGVARRFRPLCGCADGSAPRLDCQHLGKPVSGVEETVDDEGPGSEGDG